MKKFAVLLIVIYCFMSMTQVKVLAEESPSLSAASAVVLDTITGRVIFEKNAQQKRSMASTTKIMTAVIALEKADLDDMVKTSAKAAHVEGSSIWLSEGETMRMEDLVYGLMLSSGNDAAIAIAEHVAGSEEKFAEMMTQKAREIGAKDTCFKNPNGLDQDGHFTTAYDLALITKYALKNNKFAEIVKTKKKNIPWQGHEWDRTLVNHNKLLNAYEGCDGIKTGYTKKTGRCLVSSATRNNWQVVAVTLNAPDDWDDHKKMLDYAFEHYKIKNVVQTGDFMKTLSVKSGEKENVQLVAASSLSLPVKEGEALEYNISYDVPDYTFAPVLYQQKIGTVTLFVNGQKCGSAPLMSNEIVQKIFMKTINSSLETIIRGWFLSFMQFNYILR